MTQLFSVICDGELITDNVKSCSISLTIGRVFNTGTLTIAGLSPELLIRKDIVITHEENIFNGFVFSYTKGSYDTYVLNLRSDGGKLAEPFFLDTEAIIQANSASALCEYYASVSGVPVQYNAVALDFNGSWIADSTPDSELMKLANVTGAEIYDDNTGVVISPAKTLHGDTIEITADEIIEYAVDDNSIMNNNLGVVIVQFMEESNSTTEDEEGNIIAVDKINVDLDECTGLLKVYVSPAGELDSYKGVTLLKSDFYAEKTEKIMLINDTTFQLMGAISDVSDVSINGVPIDNYKFEADTNLIYFDTPQNGYIRVTYSTSYFLMSLDTTQTPDGLFGSFYITKDGDHVEWAGFLVCPEGEDYDDNLNPDPDDNHQTGTFRDFTYYTAGTNYVKGATVYSFGVIPTYKLFSGSSTISTGGRMTVSSQVYPFYERVSLYAQADGSYRGYLRLPVSSIEEITSGGTAVSYTVEEDTEGDSYLKFAQFYPDVQALYASYGIKYSIQYAQDTEGKQQSLVLFADTTGDGSADITAEIMLEGLYDDDPDKPDDSWYDPTQFPCGYPADYPINVAQLLGMQLVDVVGKVIPSMGTVDNKGFIYVNITQDGIYEYDTSSVMALTTITLRANSNGSL